MCIRDRSMEWAQYISETHVIPDRSSNIECSSMCQIKPSCNCFVLVGDQCHMGSPDNQLSFLGDQGIQIMVYVDRG